ncbi:TetR/AcrR family transcriptional regulator [Pedobacter sp. BS3]|uniref:TetR/AcrR family transcriptional regulator n=1 Tax=Pedobacter sp. BS3 TaxID=2567937 RepID=UPI0011EF4C39|nr:TetR/AcrR family transcriptional regulator [Pedobacter sp. BS3]TZF84656.1 TetR/AcrR family transcriptional regulator [Pedobacter sp. BS3]
MRQRDENKAELIKKKAVEMIVKQGLEGFGVNKLAKEVGLSVGTIYVYFKNKEAILTTLCNEISANILASSLKGLSADMEFAEGIKLQWKNRYYFYKLYPEQVAFIEKVRYSDIYLSVTENLNKRYGTLLGAFINKAVQDGQLAKMPFEVYWALAFAPLYQLINFGMNNTTTSSTFQLTEAKLEFTLKQVLQGLKP